MIPEVTVHAFADEIEKIAGLGGSNLGAWGERALVGALPGSLVGGGVAQVTGDRKRPKKERDRRAVKGALIGAIAGAGGGMGLGRYMQHRVAGKAAEHYAKTRDAHLRAIGRLRNKGKIDEDMMKELRLVNAKRHNTEMRTAKEMLEDTAFPKMKPKSELSDRLMEIDNLYV